MTTKITCPICEAGTVTWPEELPVICEDCHIHFQALWDADEDKTAKAMAAVIAMCTPFHETVTRDIIRETDTLQGFHRLLSTTLGQQEEPLAPGACISCGRDLGPYGNQELHLCQICHAALSPIQSGAARIENALYCIAGHLERQDADLVDLKFANAEKQLDEGTTSPKVYQGCVIPLRDAKGILADLRESLNQ